MYNIVLLLLFLICLPKWLWEAIRYKKHRRSFLEKLGFRLPSFNLKGPVIWVHSISVGETKAVAPLIATIQEKTSHFSIVVSTTTETGQEEAKRSLKNIDQIFYLPFDFSWTIRKLVKKINPTLLILVEGDFWFNLVTHVPHVALVNGKISEKSLSRFCKVPFFSRPLFQKIDLFCLQSHLFLNRFKLLGVDESRLIVTGNLKFDQPFPHIDKEKWKHTLGLLPEDRVITIGSTHETEEENILTALLPLMDQFPTLKILIVPRHPERFSSIAALLEKKKIPFSLFSNKDKKERVLLIDAMGILSTCYQLSELAIVGGSFVPHVGGHNIFEPAALGIPVLFGPHMEAQKNLVKTVLDAGAGSQVTLEDLREKVEALLLSPQPSMSKAGLKLAEQMHGATARTWEAIERLLEGIKRV
jgi:3-deoxy-D-manno-octulosonic-acid transferase